jgi:hypothetical protein
MKISYAITVCNELEEVKRLLDLLLANKREQDEIVVLVDTTKPNDELISTLRHYEMHNMDHMVVWPGEFEGHFADWKNKLTSLCSGDYVFQIDADEIPNKFLIENLPILLEENPEIDVLLAPRENYVTGLTQEHINKWGWVVDEKNRINWPDLQWRIYKNSPKIKWINKVHERLDGFEVYTHLPIEPEWSLEHIKDIKRQEKQNSYYDSL